MKNVALAVLTALTISVSGIAQERKHGERLSLEQRNQLQLKKMTADLDLNDNQQKEIAKLLAEQGKKREAKMAERKGKKDAKKELTGEEKFKMKNEMLDAQIEHKAKMKKILNDKQYEKWEANHEKRQEKMRNHKNKRRHAAKEKEMDVK